MCIKLLKRTTRIVVLNDFEERHENINDTSLREPGMSFSQSKMGFFQSLRLVKWAFLKVSGL